MRQKNGVSGKLTARQEHSRAVIAMMTGTDVTLVMASASNVLLFTAVLPP